MPLFSRSKARSNHRSPLKGDRKLGRRKDWLMLAGWILCGLVLTIGPAITGPAIAQTWSSQGTISSPIISSPSVSSPVWSSPSSGYSSSNSFSSGTVVTQPSGSVTYPAGTIISNGVVTYPSGSVSNGSVYKGAIGQGSTSGKPVQASPNPIQYGSRASQAFGRVTSGGTSIAETSRSNAGSTTHKGRFDSNTQSRVADSRDGSRYSTTPFGSDTRATADGVSRIARLPRASSIDTGLGNAVGNGNSIRNADGSSRFTRASTNQPTAYREIDRSYRDNLSEKGRSKSLRPYRPVGRPWNPEVDGQLHPVTEPTYATNDELYRRLQTLNQDRDALEIKLANVDQEQRFMADDLDNVRAKLAEFGLTPTIGLLLRHRREQLSGAHLYDDHILHARESMTAAQTAQLELDYIAAPVVDVPAEAEEQLFDAGLNVTQAEEARVRYQFTRLLDYRNDLLEQLKYGYRDYGKRLDDLDTAAAASKATVDEYRKLIDKNVTWIRSGHALRLGDVGESWRGLGALFDSQRTEAFGNALGDKMTRHPLVAFGGLFVMLALVLVRWRLKKSIVDRGRARNRDSSLPRQTAVVGLMTLVLAAVVPGVLFAISQFFRYDHETHVSLINASTSLGTAAMVLLLIEIPRQASRSMGLIDKQVLHSLKTRQSMFRLLTSLAVIMPVLAYFMTLTEIIDHGLWRNSLARFTFLAFVGVMAFAAHLLFRPKRGLIRPVLKATHNGWAFRLRYVLYVLAVGMPLMLMMLTVAGYGYTAGELLHRSIDTVIFLATTWVVAKIGGQVVAWIWAKLQSDDTDEDGIKLVPGDMVGKLKQRFSDAKQSALQSHLVFLGRCGISAAILGGLLMLWIEIVPSLQVANPTVWTIFETDHQLVADNDGQSVWQPFVMATDITLAKIALALATLFFTIQIAKTLPLMVDVLVLDHLFRDETMKRMLVACGRGLIFLVGGVMAARMIGLRWEMIQWIVAAAFIGAGFGAQDMVKNLLGGLVVLYERPAKTGDRITVGKMTGRVTAQRLRTTVLADDDGRELIVPNKKFVSEDVVNWTDSKLGRRAA